MRLRPFCLIAIAAAPLAACGNPNAVSVKAEIASIERKCSYRSVAGERKGRPITERMGEMLPCDTTDEFEALRRNPGERRKNIVGKGTLTVSFTSPKDQSFQTAEIKIDGNDDEFYAHRGDAIDVWVDKTDPSKAWL
jgi:hypothetical protein